MICFAFLSSVSAQDIRLLSSTSLVDSYGQYRVVGEVQNTSNVTKTQVILKTTFYDSKNVDVGYVLTLTKMTYIPPNVSSAFTVIANPNSFSDPSHISHYTIEIHSSREGSVEEGLQILPNISYNFSKGYIDINGEYINIKGEIQNVGKATSNYTAVCATFYDSSGKAIDTAVAYPDPENITAGSTAHFLIRNIDSSRTPLYASYSLFTEGSNYAQVTANLFQSPIPIQSLSSPTPSTHEFPILMILALFLIIPLLVMILLRGNSKLKVIAR